ncbi:tol-pal system protein YbgF [Amphritea balenae]|uniref:Cell division coordinator CpoB n=1 Tax=Amphritea balenae TaxID=452629 RepID=A0A3P1SJD5_9GAMM|nr:tol-pal system protein YbgF [Amphritea balenae]RRC96855.1 tol-pal system protein YbgF [Amphritea balenae]GGK61142.1 tol-pal system protein YbgF [Amphritea balenae]
MRKACSLAAALVLISASAVAADPVPVIELQIEDSGSSATSNLSSGAYADNSNEMLMILQQLQDEVRSLRGMVEQQQHQIRKMEQQQRDRYRDLDRRIASQGSVAPANTALSPSGLSSDQVATPPTPLPATDNTPTDSQAYQQAFALVRQKDFPAALAAFDKFIELYPESARLANAYYWVGEVNLAEQQLEPAKVAFEHVLTKFPQHRKASDASYKIGVIYHQMGDQANADEMFKNTVSRYPDSSAAGLARDYLKR